MDGGFDRQVLARLPLAEAVLTLAKEVIGVDGLLDQSYHEHRGRCHTRVLAFPQFVRILFDCVSRPCKSARAGLLKALDEGRLPVSPKAFYDKLKRTPVAVSLAFFRDAMQRLQAVAPEHRPGCPASLQRFKTLLIDGKVVKHVCRRLTQLRLCKATACKLLGPRTLVVADRWSGLLLDLVVDLDGEANEVKYVGPLLQRVTASVPAPFLLVGDRAFGIFAVCQQIVAATGDFLLRQHGGSVFVADPQQPAVTSRDRFGRTVTQRWGWLVRGQETKRTPRPQIPVRQLTVQRSTTTLVLITSLLDAAAYPVDDVLDSYLARWDIESMFQKVTEVFQLRHLFSTTPQGMLFQLVLAFLMHNIVQVVKQVIVQEEGREEARVSTAMLFRDIQEELIGVTRLLTPEAVVDLIGEYPSPAAVRHRLRQLLKGCWCNRWEKANYRPRDPSRLLNPKPPKLRQQKSHDSVQRILLRDQQ
jgi:hypothetical protein